MKLLFLLAWLSVRAQDHALGELAPVVATEAAIPEGPPRTLEIRPGEPVQEAIASLPAGSTLRLLPGTHGGPALVDRPLVIEGEGATLRGQGRGTVLIVAASDVVVRGLRVAGSGSDSNSGDSGVLVGGDRVELDGLLVEDSYIGIDLRQANDNHVHDCRIVGREHLAMGLRGDGVRLWESDRNRVEDNEIHGTRDMVVWYSYQNTFAGNRVSGGRYGTHFMHASDNRVVDNAYDGNVVGVFVMYSDRIVLERNRVSGARGEAGVGLGFKDSDEVEARDNALLGNTTGIYLDGTPHRVGGSAVFERNLVAYNHTGLRLHGLVQGASLLENDLHENGLPVVADGGASAERVRFEGNRWSEYAGYDLDRDGVGDLPFELRSATNGIVDRRPLARFFHGTPAASLLDLLAAAFPMFAPPPLLVDPRPRLGGAPLIVGPRGGV